MRAYTRILGIDPGFRLTGYGIVDSNGQESRLVASGVIPAHRGDGTAARLNIIHSEVAQLVAEHGPAEMAVESVFVHKNAQSALKLGQARAAAICASFGYEVAVFEYAPREIKQAIVGKGSAGKEQVAHMVQVLLGLRDELQADEADALGIALCHAHQRTVNNLLAGALSGVAS